jgi:integrase/recombinase XerD
VLELYQRWLFHFRKPSGKPLTFSAQRQRVQKLRVFFRWLTLENVLPSNPASDLEMPRIERRLPRAVLTEREVDAVLTLADFTDPLACAITRSWRSSTRPVSAAKSSRPSSSSTSSPSAGR